MKLWLGTLFIKIEAVVVVSSKKSKKIHKNYVIGKKRLYKNGLKYTLLCGGKNTR
jgi:hypothetical protein